MKRNVSIMRSAGIVNAALLRNHSRDQFTLRGNTSRISYFPLGTLVSRAILGVFLLALFAA